MILVVVGSALFTYNRPYEQRMKERIRALGIENNVRLLGHREDVPLILQTLDLLILPSTSEPFPMILLEAMAARLPAIAFAVDGIPEVLDDGLTGWLVPPGDTVKLGQALVWAARHPEQRVSVGAAAARALLVTDSTPESYARRFVAVVAARGRVHVRTSTTSESMPRNAQL